AKTVKSRKPLLIGAIAALILALGVGVAAITGVFGGSGNSSNVNLEVEKLAAFWPEAFSSDDSYVEPPFEDVEGRTNNAFNVQDFGPQGNNGWFYRYGSSKKPQRSRQVEYFDGETYTQPGANGLEIKSTFLHTAQGISPILEWRAAEDGKVNIKLTYVKNVNGDANPSYPDGVQLLVYKGSELLKVETVDISTTEELLVQIFIDELELKKGESLYFVVDPRTNNAFDGGSLYVDIRDVDSPIPQIQLETGRKNNNANNQADYGEQGAGGWCYLYGTEPLGSQPVSHKADGAYINSTSPNLTISQGFIHPAINDNAVLCWAPAVNGDIDLRVKYTKFEQNDGNPDFPDGVKVKVYLNDQLLYEEHVDAPAQGENKISFRAPKLAVTTQDRLYFMVDAEGNASYDGGAFDITIIDINGAQDESSVSVNTGETRQNIANVNTDFGPQGSNGWIFQSGYGDDPFHAYNMDSFDRKEDRYFENSYLEIKRDYVNPGEHGRSAVIKWRVAQNGTVSVKASYTKLKNEDKNPAWPDGTRVSLYYKDQLLAQQSFAPEVDQEVTKRLDVASLRVEQGAYITMVINGLDNIAYDGGKYEFAITSLSGLVGKTENSVAATPNPRTNFASTMDDFGAQGKNGWYYQYGYNLDPFMAVNVERYENGEKYLTSDGIEIKKDYIVPAGNGKSANVKWVAAQSGRINIDLEYTKLKNEDANPSWPDGVTVYLMKNGTVLRKVYFAPLTNQEVTKSLSVENLSVNKGDCITMIVDPGKNAAYDGGKYMFVIEDADQAPKVQVGNYDNNTSLGELSSVKQGTDGWWFLEGRSPADAKVLTKLTADGMGYLSRRTEGLEMKNGYVHTGATRDPIYQWVAGQTGKIDVSGEYMKFGQQDANPNWPDGVTLKIWLNDKLLKSQKVKVLRGDGNNNVVSFAFDGLSVKRGDKLSFQVCADGNYAWDGGQLSVAIEAVTDVTRTPGDDNNTSLAGLSSLEQGADGWWFLEGTSPANAKLLTKMNADKTAYLSRKTEALEMKKDYVHPGATQDAIYQWIAAEDGQVDVAGSYVKFGQQDANPSYPDGVTLKIWLNDKLLKSEKVRVLQGDGNNNVVSFSFDRLEIKRGDKLSFQICSDGNFAWDAGQLSVAIEKTTTVQKTPGDDNNSILANIPSMEQGTDGWWFLEGTSLANAKVLTNLNADGTAYISARDSGLEMKRDYVHPGTTQNPIYQWVVKEDGQLDIKGSYVKFGHNDGNPDWPDGVTLIISQNDNQLFRQTVKALQGDGNDNTVEFNFQALSVKAGDIFSFQISPNGNNAWDAGRLSVIIGDESASQPVIDEVEPDPNRTNNTSLSGSFTDKQGYDGWYYGSCDWDSKNFTKLPYDAENQRYYLNGKPELKKDFVEPGNGKNAAYKWIVAQDGTIQVEGEYVKFANSEDPTADGTCVRFFLNGVEKKWMGSQTMGNFAEERKESFSETYTVKAGDELIFAVNPEGNDSWDGGRLTVTISPVEGTDPGPGPEPEPDRENSTVLKDDFSDTQGKNGWYYGAADWDGKNFTELGWTGEAWKNNGGKPELKADFVEPGGGRNAAYKWVVAKDGSIHVTGDYTKFAYDEEGATGTCFRVRLNGQEKVWMGMNTADSSEERSEGFDLTLEVKAGDELLFLVDPEGSDAWDGGRLSVTIAPAEGTEPQPQADKAALQAAIEDAEALNQADYTEESWAALAQALAEAKAVNDKTDATQEAVDAALEALNNAMEALEEKPQEPSRINNADLAKDFSDTQGSNGWYYGAADWDGKNFTELSWNGEAWKNGDSKPELKADFVEPGGGRNAAYKWIAAQDGSIRVTGDYTKFAYNEAGATGTCFRIRLNGEEKKFIGMNAADASEERSEGFDLTLEVKAGDELLFLVDPEGSDAWDGGRLSASISPTQSTEPDPEPQVDKTALQAAIEAAEALNQADYTEESWAALAQALAEAKAVNENAEATQEAVDAALEALNNAMDALVQKPAEPVRTNNANLADDFSDTQGSNGWYYGAADWDGKNFAELSWTGEAWKNGDSKPELKADFVEPGNGRNAAYKWVAAQDGSIHVTGDYTKFSYNEEGATGTCFRIRLNGEEKKFIGMNTPNASEERSESFDLSLDVKAGDELLFLVDPEGSDAWDGGRLSVNIQAN
ncbi:MAG: FIVAR domain-containing protein, partial [Oscillospiraceae bacterium]|nr:FIVAR domain-containing protein [Oscillospiraceae bacterium]